MSTVHYKCPCCASALVYDGKSGKLACGSCGNTFDVAEMEALGDVSGSDVLSFRVDAEQYSAADAVGEYHCQSCGAQLVSESTTTATECPYCGSPVILAEHIASGIKPEKVVPFLITKDQATAMFDGYFKGKKLLPRVFVKSENHIAEMRKLYVPYWLFNCQATGDYMYSAEKKRTEVQGEWRITHTDHYGVRRAGTLAFEDIPVDGSAKMDRAIAESLEPYDIKQAVPFQSAVLSGSMADCADLSADDCSPRAAERVKTTTEQTMRDTVRGYDTVTTRSGSVQTEDGKATPVLMPVWMITTQKQEKTGEKTYTFAINGQTGSLTCDVPYDKSKYWTWLLIVFAIAMAVGTGVLGVMGAIGSGSLLIVGVIALIIALATVSSMAAQLRTAHKQHAANSYVVKNSLQLTRKVDQFLYTTTTRERIQQKTDQQAGA